MGSEGHDAAPISNATKVAARTPQPNTLRRRGSVRVRSAVAALLIVGVAFAASAAGVLLVMGHALDNSAASLAQAKALDISYLIGARGHLPPHLPISTEEMAAQLLDANGNVVVSSRNIVGQPAMVDLHPSPGADITRIGVVIHVRRLSHVHLNLGNRFAVAAVGYRAGDSAGTILVAESLGAADHAVDLVAVVLGIAFPLITILVAGLVWIVTGWALRPVELIRAQVDRLSATELHRRVPEPAVRDEIGRLARTMNSMLDRLDTSNERQRQLVADVSHELRNPLAALRAQLEVAAAHPAERTSTLLEGSILDVDRMSQLVGDLLTLARLDEGTSDRPRGEVDLDELALLHADRLRRRGRVQVSVEGVRAARINGDEMQLSRVVANLADNAERHARHRVCFAVAPQGTSFVLSVTDDGPGVPQDERRRIFDRFVRLDSARTHRGTGAGLGLAIVREIVLAHGGEVWVEDAAPGARFLVRLPRTEARLEADRRASPEAS